MSTCIAELAVSQIARWRYGVLAFVSHLTASIHFLFQQYSRSKGMRNTKTITANKGNISSLSQFMINLPTSTVYLIFIILRKNLNFTYNYKIQWGDKLAPPSDHAQKKSRYFDKTQKKNTRILGIYTSKFQIYVATLAYQVLDDIGPSSFASCDARFFLPFVS